MISNLLDPIDAFRPGCRAVWTAPREGESKAPYKRIIHSRFFSYDSPVRVARIGVRLGKGYFKCGSEDQSDWCSAIRILRYERERWIEVAHITSIPRPAAAEPIIWLAHEPFSAESLIIECRESGVDGWWTSWNLAMTGLVLEVEEFNPQPADEHFLELGDVDLANPPDGIVSTHINGQILYETKWLKVAFSLTRAAMTYLSFDPSGNGRTSSNLLQGSSYFKVGPTDKPLTEYLTQGTRLSRVGASPDAAYFYYRTRGRVTCKNNILTYQFLVPEAQIEYKLQWSIFPDRMVLAVERNAEEQIRAWNSGVWHFVFNTEVAITTTLGKPVERGETGTMELPCMIHSPGFGSLSVAATRGEWLGRSDSVRPLLTTTTELKLDEQPQAEGDYIIPSGRREGELEFTIRRVPVACAEDTPTEVQEALNNCLDTSLTYRADVGSFSNNGNSIQCAFCMDSWVTVGEAARDHLPEFPVVLLEAQSLERWLLGGPAYGCGPIGAKTHRFEDEYLQTPASCLNGLAHFLARSNSEDWFLRFHSEIERELVLMRARDLDGDGLVESPYRTGISGTNQWSTNWWDVISFGWKDAFVNATLYNALRVLEDVLPRYGDLSDTLKLREWADLIQKNYVPTFFNPATGWLAGWRSKDGVLHDHGFLFVNGAAAAHGLFHGDAGVNALRSLFGKLGELSLNLENGIPGNILRVPDADTASCQQLLPHGCYENGGQTLSQSHHFVAGLYALGLKEEADSLLRSLCCGLARGTAFGGCGSGVDWRRWDGSRCGYEGLLSDQFVILAVARWRYAPGS